MRRALCFLALAGLFAVLVGCGTHEADAPVAAETDGLRFRNVADAVAYVGDEACASCHEDLYESYQHHGMAQSLYPMTAERVVEDFSGVVLVHEASGFYYTVYERDGAYVQEEYRLDAQGRKTHRLARTMDYVVGSGTAARTYLTEHEGRYYELPLTWYTQAEEGAGRWDFSPGYREANGRFERAIPPRCMACHNDVSDPVPFVEGAFREIAHGIGCERCHGPGDLHVEERLIDPEPADSIDYTIVNPAHLSLDRRLDVCQQCHLNGTISLLREGKEAFGFKPSQPLAAHIALFDLETDEVGTISVISHADRMRMSPCFQESAGMDCTTCHNPHEGFRSSGPAYFNQTCIACHPAGALQQAVPAALQAEHGPDGSCFACHMPKVEAEDAPHSSFTDHYIRVVEPEERVVAVTAEAPEEEVVLEPYFERDRGSAEGAVYEGMAYVAYGRQQARPEVMRAGAERLAEALRAQPEIGEGQFLLGFARMQLGEAAAAIPPLEEAVRLGPGVPERLNALAQAYEQTGRNPADIERLYREALTIQPALADVQVNYGRFLETQGRLSAAEHAYRAAIEVEPWLEAGHYNLGTLLLRQGQPEAAAEHLAEAIRLDPDHVDALVNLGILRASQGQVAEAGTLFEQAVKAGPEHPNALANLGTYHLQRGAPAEAAEVLQRAVTAAPRHVDATANLALAYYQLGRTQEARQYAEAALRLNPRQATAQQILQALP